MATLLVILAAFSGFTVTVHLVTALVAALRCRPVPPQPAPADAPAVTLIRPVCGLENNIAATLASSFALAYPRYEIVFCVASAEDPVIPLVRQLIAAHPRVAARLLVGDERINSNPKLNNVIKGWRAAAHDWVVIADSNVLMPADYLQRLLAAWRSDTGLVCSPPVGCAPEGFFAEVECAFLNSYQARWQYVADTLGLGFAQGKTMLWRRADLDRAGGIGALAGEVAEDAAATKVVRGAGRRVRLVDAPFGQPLGRRGAREVWHRQLRWARLRRASFPLFFAPEILSGGLAPALAAAIVAALTGHSIALTAGAVIALWYGAELALALAAGWHVSVWTPFAALLRDALLPVLWVKAWTGTGFVWRGNAMQVARTGESR